MNLHIVPDSKFVNTFCANLRELGLFQNNRVIVRSNKNLRYIEHDLPHANLYSPKFKRLIGDTGQYDAVYIHLFSPLMYRWVATHAFKELNWIVWGADLYNLPFIHVDFYEQITRKQYSTKNKSLAEWLYLLKVWMTNMPYKKKAYLKVDRMLTWMKTEYAFARTNIPPLRAEHKFFFYENQVPYEKLDASVLPNRVDDGRLPAIIVGNSGYPTNNHLDVVEYMVRHHVKANLYIPVSYGDKDYIHFLKQNLAGYANGKIEFLDRYMSFEEYLRFLLDADALVMNNIRPQGYGNVLMMLYLGKPVFLNEKNISLPDLRENGMVTNDWSEMNSVLNLKRSAQNKEAIINLLSHERLLGAYTEFFSP
jgi:dTDP-N-acetylfucosamine:lipid II N-acetylfucosaminyltransferase